MKTEKKQNQSELNLPLSNWEKFFEVISITGILLFFVPIFFSWGTLPGQIPQQPSINGVFDVWGSHTFLLFLPIMALLLYFLLTNTGMYPHVLNYLYKINEQNKIIQYKYARQVLVALKAEIIWLFLYLEWVTIEAAFGRINELNIMFLPVFLTIIFFTIGIYLYKAKKAR